MDSAIMLSNIVGRITNAITINVIAQTSSHRQWYDLNIARQATAAAAATTTAMTATAALCKTASSGVADPHLSCNKNALDLSYDF